MKKLKFQPVITTHWASEDGRFRITGAIPSGFCALDEYSYDSDSDQHLRKEFTATLEEAIAWCEERA